MITFNLTESTHSTTCCCTNREGKRLDLEKNPHVENRCPWLSTRDVIVIGAGTVYYRNTK